VSVATISGVSSKIASNVLLRTPKKKRPRTKLICDLDENHEMEIRNVIYDMVKNSKYLLNIVMQIIIANFIFRETYYKVNSATSPQSQTFIPRRRIFLGKVLKGIGFRFRKDDPRRGLIELPRIALSWLQERHIPFTSELLKVQLLEIVTRYRYLVMYFINY
jgi:hypothetical protein